MKHNQSFVNDVIPSYMLQDGNNTLITLIDKYYQFEQQHGNIKQSYDFLNHLNSFDDLNVNIYHQLLYRLLPVITLDKETINRKLIALFKFARTYYNNKGNLDSYQFLFKVLFDDDDLIVTNTADKLLRSSDGVVIQENSLIVQRNTGFGLPIELLVNRDNVMMVNADRTKQVSIKIHSVDILNNDLVRVNCNERVKLKIDDVSYVTLSNFDELFQELDIFDNDMKETIKHHCYYGIYKQICNYQIVNSGKGYTRNTLLTYDLVKGNDVIKYADLPDEYKKLQIVISDVDYQGGIKRLDIKGYPEHIITDYWDYVVKVNCAIDDVLEIAQIELMSDYVQFERKQVKSKSTLSTEYRLRDKDYHHEYGYSVNTNYKSPESVYSLIKDILHPSGFHLVFNAEQNKERLDVGNQGMLFNYTLEQLHLNKSDKLKVNMTATVKELGEILL